MNFSNPSNKIKQSCLEREVSHKREKLKEDTEKIGHKKRSFLTKRKTEKEKKGKRMGKKERGKMSLPIDIMKEKRIEKE